MMLIADLKGLWRRSLIEFPDGRRDVTTRVYWLQGDRLFVDLRQPASLPACSRDCLDELTMQDLENLSHQQAFAGRLGFDGRHFEWHRQIDYQPTTGVADAGSLEWRDEVLIERGRDVDYVEHWHRDAAAPLAPHAAVELRDAERGTRAFLVRVGNAFMFARDRTVSLGAHRSLVEYLEGTLTLQSARQGLDCEISFGTVDSSGFRILASTLPFRREALLGQQMLGRRLTTQDPGIGGITLIRAWDLTEIEGDLGALLHIV
jgi:hypothetical protein